MNRRILGAWLLALTGSVLVSMPVAAVAADDAPDAVIKQLSTDVLETITFDDKTFQALVTLALDTRYAFPKDSSLKILTSGLLGEQYIGIEAGADEKNLAQGDRVTTTQSAVVLENLISQFIYGKAEEGTKTGGSKK